MPVWLWGRGSGGSGSRRTWKARRRLLGRIRSGSRSRDNRAGCSPCRLRPAACPRPARAADGVGERPEGVGVQRSGIRDVAGLLSRGHQLGLNQLLAWEQVGVWVPRAVPQGQLAVEDLDVDRLADL